MDLLFNDQNSKLLDELMADVHSDQEREETMLRLREYFVQYMLETAIVYLSPAQLTEFERLIFGSQKSSEAELIEFFAGVPGLYQKICECVAEELMVLKILHQRLQ